MAHAQYINAFQIPLLLVNMARMMFVTSYPKERLCSGLGWPKGHKWWEGGKKESCPRLYQTIKMLSSFSNIYFLGTRDYLCVVPTVEKVLESVSQK